MTQTLRVIGMTCGHCARTIERAVTELPNVQNVRVDLSEEALFYSGDAPRSDIVAAVRDAGYDVEEQ